MNPRKLAYLSLVIERGGFAEAAASAGVSQPAISRAMQSLSRELGLTLFAQEGRRRVPTPMALDLARAAGPLQSALDAVSGLAAGKQARARLDLVRAGMSQAAAMLYAPLIRHVVREVAPQAQIQLSTGEAPDMLAALLREELDFVVAPRPRRHPRADLSIKVMYESEPRIYANSSHALVAATSLGDLVEGEWIVAGPAGSPGNTIEEAFRVRGLGAPKVAVQCRDYGLLVHMIESTSLLGVVSHPALIDASRLRSIRSISIRESLPRYEVCLFKRPDKAGAASAPVGAAIDALLAAGEP